jgi:hypothetical protein
MVLTFPLNSPTCAKLMTAIMIIRHKRIPNPAINFLPNFNLKIFMTMSFLSFDVFEGYFPLGLGL